MYTRFFTFVNNTNDSCSTSGIYVRLVICNISFTYALFLFIAYIYKSALYMALTKLFDNVLFVAHHCYRGRGKHMNIFLHNININLSL